MLGLKRPVLCWYHCSPFSATTAFNAQSRHQSRSSRTSWSRFSRGNPTLVPHEARSTDPEENNKNNNNNNSATVAASLTPKVAPYARAVLLSLLHRALFLPHNVFALSGTTCHTRRSIIPKLHFQGRKISLQNKGDLCYLHSQRRKISLQNKRDLCYLHF